MSKTVSVSLNSAVTLHYTHTEGFKTARLSLFTVMPASGTESPLTTLLFGILRRGSERYPRLALLNRRLDELYGTALTIRNYLHGDNHVVSYTAEMLEEDFLPPHDRSMDILGGVTEVLADMILRPLQDPDGGLRAEAVEAEKLSLCDSLRSLQNDPRAWAGNRLREIMCEGEPYGLSIGGNVEQVAAITPARVTERYRHMLEMTRMEVFYTGRASVEAVTSAWNRAFDGWTPLPADAAVTALHPIPATPRRVQEDMEISQGKLCMAWSCGENFTTLRQEPDALAAYAVCNELFGVMQNSLLFRRVREERGLCYFCDSALDMTKGILWVSCGIRPDRLAETEAAVNACLSEMREGTVDPADVELAKLSLLNSYRQLQDSQASLEVFALNRLLNLTSDTAEEEMERIAHVTPAAVAAAARRFVPDTVFFLNGTIPEGEEDDRYELYDRSDVDEGFCG